MSVKGTDLCLGDECVLGSNAPSMATAVHSTVVGKRVNLKCSHCRKSRSYVR